jgi:hypothetical protein
MPKQTGEEAVMEIRPLVPDALRPRCNVEEFTFETTAELTNLTEVIGQARALDAVRFGVGIKRDVDSRFLGQQLWQATQAHRVAASARVGFQAAPRHGIAGGRAADVYPGHV